MKSSLKKSPANKLSEPVAGLRQRSGSVNSDDGLTAFLYVLMRDHLPPGVVESCVLEHVERGHKSQYCNGWLASYAKDLARRIKDKS